MSISPQNSSASTCTSHNFDRDQFARDLVDWFQQHQRDLPWRESENSASPYRILVSEVMLQQTTVAAVIPFYHRFLARFPTVQVLAAASIDEVLPLWAGLGYYSRARNLHRCAQVVVEQFGGEFPRDLDEVLKLPGIGRYTSGAVTSIAFDAPNPIVDANVARVLARVCVLESELKAPKTQSQLWLEAANLVESAHAQKLKPSEFNPAMMELGALICRPRDPQCEICPVRNHCGARQQNRQHELPRLSLKKAPTPLHDVCALASRIRDGEEKWLLRQRSHSAGIWWRGMWELPRVTVENGESPEESLQNFLRNAYGIETNVGAKISTLKHGVTTFDITLDCYEIEVKNDIPARDDIGWFNAAQIEALALPSPMRKLWNRLQAEAAKGQRSLF